MPNLVGMNLRDARSAAPSNHSERDLSPRGRDVWDQDNWTVAATVPAAGAKILENDEVFLFYLRNQEWRWFQVNPVMPPLPAGESYQLSESSPDIRELIEYRYAEGTAPEYASDVRRTAATSSIPGDPSIERESEWGPRDRLKHATGGTIAGSLPGAGQPLRPGQLITVLVKPTPLPASTTTGTYGGGSVDLNDDEHNNLYVPGDRNGSSGGGGGRGGGFCRSKWC
ncbi:PASTA domain-containing protein [Parafrankia sp. EUN1f]|uniref:PASTA domain-containing protein n=1 Tax=Parafrankia sp. EUN1f TaxID=102897 RepID=UPI001E52954A|nr:PASTA domain-containing protein [Parafrankia sp. EUN1f]